MILHKKKDTLNHSYCIMKVTKQTLQHLRKKVPLANTIHHSIFLYNQFKKLNLCKSFSNRVIGHLMSILSSIFISGYHGKTTDFAQNSSCHRTTIAHFLNSEKWDDTLLENTLKSSVVEIIYSEAQSTGKPVFCIVDDSASHSEEIPPFLPNRFEPGTPNIPGILGLHAALCDLEKQSMTEILSHELMLTQYFIDGILNLDPEEKFLRIISKKNIENRCAVVSVQTLHMAMAQAAST